MGIFGRARFELGWSKVHCPKHYYEKDGNRHEQSGNSDRGTSNAENITQNYRNTNRRTYLNTYI